MLTSKKVIKAINEQIGYEFSASMQYYAIAAISRRRRCRGSEHAFLTILAAVNVS
jgi:ferritin